MAGTSVTIPNLGGPTPDIQTDCYPGPLRDIMLTIGLPDQPAARALIDGNTTKLYVRPRDMEGPWGVDANINGITGSPEVVVYGPAAVPSVAIVMIEYTHTEVR